MDKAIFSIFKNEGPYLREWVAFHKIQGFEKFYLYNNESEDDWKSELQDFIDLGYVEVIDWPGKAQQFPAYWDYINKMKNNPEKPRWTAFIDIDEFIYSRSGRKVSEILDENQNIDCIIATWLMFGHSGHREKPEGLVIDNFVNRANNSVKSDHFKSIVDVSKIIGFSNPHEFTIAGETINLDDLKINHYWTKSEQEWQAKWERGRSDTGNRHSLEESKPIINLSNEFEDLTIKNFWSEEVNKFIKGKNE